MEAKEFVSYEIAVALKELGFDEPCFAFYNGKFLDYKIQGGDICSPYLSTENIGECPNAPTFSQVFRWFREKYNLNVSQERDGGWWLFHIVDTSNEDTEGSVEVEGSHIHKVKYEEAELECLKKLIEIVKQW